jgi:hypothetical protein
MGIAIVAASLLLNKSLDCGDYIGLTRIIATANGRVEGRECQIERLKRSVVAHIKSGIFMYQPHNLSHFATSKAKAFRRLRSAAE